MKILLLFSSLFVTQNLHAEIKGYIAPKLSLGYSFQNENSTIDAVIDESQMRGFTYALGVNLIRHGTFAGLKYQNVEYSELAHNYFLFNLGTNFGTVSDESMGFGIQIALGWDDYEWKQVPTPINKYSSLYEGASFAYGVGISYYIKPWKNLIIQLEYEALETSNSTSDIAKTLEDDPSGEISFGFNSSFMLTINYGFGVGRYEAPKKSKDIEEKDTETKKAKEVAK